MIMSTKPNLLFSQPDTIAIARVPTVTFNTWRKRNGLFPRTTADKSLNYYTCPEVMVARTVAIMSRAGLSPKVAIKAAMDLLPEFERVWEDTYRLMAGVTAVLVEALQQSGQLVPKVQYTTGVEGEDFTELLDGGVVD